MWCIGLYLKKDNSYYVYENYVYNVINIELEKLMVNCEHVLLLKVSGLIVINRGHNSTILLKLANIRRLKVRKYYL